MNDESQCTVREYPQYGISISVRTRIARRYRDSAGDRSPAARGCPGSEGQNRFPVGWDWNRSEDRWKSDGNHATTARLCSVRCRPFVDPGHEPRTSSPMSRQNEWEDGHCGFHRRRGLKRYGTISFDSEAKAWRVECEPHVALRLKRVFAGLGKAAKRYYLISDTLDNARDLEWFIDRYPMVVTDSSRLRERACEHIERMDIVSQLLENRQPVKPFSLAFPPRDYQSQAAALLLARGSLLLADDVGIGKTLVAICTFTDPRTLPAVVVTLTHLPRQWQDELKMFAPNLTTHIIKKGTPYDLTAGRKERNGQITFADRLPDVIIMNYHKLAGWAETLARVARSVTYDECQELRRRSTNTARSLKYESAMVLSAAVKFRLGLSASPIYNYGAEMHSVMDCIAPGALGTLGEFSEEWCAGRTE